MLGFCWQLLALTYSCVHNHIYAHKHWTLWRYRVICSCTVGCWTPTIIMERQTKLTKLLFSYCCESVLRFQYMHIVTTKPIYWLDDKPVSHTTCDEVHAYVCNRAPTSTFLQFTMCSTVCSLVITLQLWHYYAIITKNFLFSISRSSCWCLQMCCRTDNWSRNNRKCIYLQQSTVSMLYMPVWSIRARCSLDMPLSNTPT